MDINIDRNRFLILFGRRVKEIRVKKKLSLRQLSIRCNIDYSDIGKIEKGQRNIQLSTLLELAKGLEVLPQELLDLDFFLNEEC